MHGSSEERALPLFDNRSNGLEEWLLEYLKAIYEHGFSEFKSIPYKGYSVQALLNLYDFAGSEKIRNASRNILDGLCWRYAGGSFGLRRHVPRGFPHIVSVLNNAVGEK